jgi:hypothetical protein
MTFSDRKVAGMSSERNNFLFYQFNRLISILETNQIKTPTNLGE